MSQPRLALAFVPLALIACVWTTAAVDIASAQPAPPYTIAGYVAPVDANGNGLIDSAEIQAVVNDATGGRGVVFLPAAATYNIDSPIVLSKPGVTLLGEGHGVSTAGGTILKIAGNVEAVVLLNCTGCGVRNVSFAGTSSHATNAVRIESCTSAYLEHVRISGTHRGIDVVNSVGPVLEDVALRALTGDYGIRVRGANGGKSDAAQLHRISASVSKTANTVIDWLVFGPNVDSVEVQSARLVAGRRGMWLVGGTGSEPGPKYVFTNKLGVDNTSNEGVRVDAASDLLMINTWIGQVDSTSGFTIGAGFTGGAVLTNLRIRGSGVHGLEINGGRDIGITNPLIGANGTALAAGSTTGAGIYVAAGVSTLRVTGGRVGPLYSQGGSARQYYGIKYDGTPTQSDAQDVKITGVSTSGNTIPFAPGNLINP